jgi:hypothetical protein
MSAPTGYGLTANPARTVHETTFDDNVASVFIRLAGDTVELVG